MKTTVIFCFVCCFLLGVVPQAPAQESGDAPKVELRLLCYQRSYKETRVAAYSPEGKVLNGGKSLALPVHQLSDPVLLPGRSFVFLRAPGEGTPEWGDGVAADASRITLPPTGKSYILLFVPLAKKEGPAYRVIPIRAPAEKFKGGSYLMVNATSTPIAGMLGRHKLVLKANGISTVPPLREDAGSSRMAVFHQWNVAENAWGQRPFTSFPVMPNTRKRELWLFFKNPRSGRMTFRAIQDPLPKPSDDN
ncbi:MAG: hypothetical protein H7A51_14935 [Akkermansiaceae bacterium]|nr:hypothetical protein [Akkermansiaceae bacterium]